MASQESILIDALVAQLKNEIAPNMEVDEYFELFTSEQILKDYDLSYDELLTGKTGNGGDGGIDSFFMFLNNSLIQPDYTLPEYKKNIEIQLFLIQSKNSNSFKETSLQKFDNSADDIFNFEKTIDKLKPVYNSNLIAHIELFRETYLKLIAKQPKLIVNYYYVAKANEVHPNVNRKVDKLKETISKYFTKVEVNFEFVTAKRLIDLSRSEKKAAFNLNLSESPITTQEGGYICLVNLNDYYNFIKDEKGNIIKHIFDANVRDYQGSVIVNKEIYDSLQSKDSIDFWWLNNGITIVSEKTNLSNKIFTIENPQIVNGCQTSFEIFNFFKDNPERIKIEKRNIMIRVIEINQDDTRSKIIKSTNSQTQIPLATLRGTDAIHRNIEEYLLPFGFFYERRKNYWKNQNKPISNIITISFLSQIIMAMIVQRPEVSRAKPSSLVKNDEEYYKIFSNNYDLSIYLKAIKLQKKIEDNLLKSTILMKGEGLNIRYFVSLYTILKARTKIINATDLLAITRDFIAMDIDNISDVILNENIEEVLKIFRKLGGTDGVAKAKYFTDDLINIFKKKSA